MKKKAKIIGIAVLFLAGLSLLLYQLVANQWNSYRQSHLISDYEHTVSGLETSGQVDYTEELQKARAYNEALLPSILPDSFAVAEAAGEPDAVYMSCLNLAGVGMMGVIEIPKIHVNIPIYHTTEETVLEKAAGHLEGSSLPVGGENTHAVIAAHRGLPSAALFTDLDQITEGDHFLLHVLDETLCYEVDQISVVEPDDTTPLMVEPGKDLVTLLTCTPYGVNTQRLLVRGHRVDVQPEEVLFSETPAGQISLHTNYFLWVLVGLLVTGCFVFLLWRWDKKKR